MTVCAVGSVRGAPGATTLALAVAATWPGEGSAVVAELDPNGGVLAARLGLGFEPGLMTLAAAARREVTPLARHLQPLSSTVGAVVAPPAAQQVRTALSVAGARLWHLLDAHDAPVMVDCGRLDHTGPVTAGLRAASATLLVTSRRLDDVALLRDRVAALRAADIRPRLVVVDDGPYPADEIAEVTGADVYAVVPRDPRGAGALAGHLSRRARRAPLLRSAAAIAARLAVDCGTGDAPPPADAASVTGGRS